MLAAYLIYTAWMTAYAAFAYAAFAYAAFAYAAIRRPATTNARYFDYFALAFFGITLLLFGWLFVVQGITPFVQGNADSGRSYQYWHLWFLAFPYLYIGHIVLLAFNTIRLLLPPYSPRFIHYAALLLTLLSGWHVGAFMPTA